MTLEAVATDNLTALESEAIHIFREVAGEFDRPVVLFSGGKDSTVLVHLARKAFWPAAAPFPLLHIDTGHNFPEVIEFRDRLVAEGGLQLLVGSVQASIDAGRVREERDPRRQRPELWDLYNARVRRGEHLRAFPISNWTELDVWQYIASEELGLPSIYMAHEREVFAR